MINLPNFIKCVDEITELDGQITIECKLGLWSVTGSKENIYVEAYHYWQQYANDGEYYKILGGKSPAELLME